MKKDNLSIGDLIEVPDVQTVIRLEQGKTNPKEIAGSFVFTREAGSHFTVITESLLKKKGGGYFLRGDFGSGKSHFLACLYSVLAFGKTITSLQQSHGGIKRIIQADIKILPVDISLIQYRARTPLEQIVILSIENALLERGIETNLTPLSSFLSWLKELLTDAALTRAFSKEFHLENRDLAAWIDEKPKDAYRNGMIFIKNQGLPTPELLIEDRHETFRRALVAIHNAGFDGVFLIIDELSEFFRSKPDTHSLNEDARTLQYLGELNQEEPLWIIAAVQESIEKTGDIAQGTFRKIKDRFPVKLVLSTLHIRALISERLVKLKPGADEKLYTIYEEYTKQFSTFSLPFNEFRSIYPVHPATIAMLDGLGDLFSVHRGIVDFVHSQIAGDDRREIRGILNRPAMELLAPDSIFDHFENRIGEFSDFHIYPRHILPHLKDIIEKVIEEEKDRDIALRLMKILVLYKIHPAIEEPDVKELTELVACTLFFQDPDMNVRFIIEGILDPLVNASSFLIKQPGSSGNPLDAVYSIIKEDNPGKLLKKRIESKEKEFSQDDSRLILIPFSELKESTAWPGPDVLEKGIQRSTEWFHSIRKVFIGFIMYPDKKAIDKYYYDFKESISDFGLLITASEKDISLEHVAVWQIPIKHLNRALFSEYVATYMVAGSLNPGNPADAPIISLVNEKYRRMQPLIHTSLIDLLYAGRFMGREIETNPVIKQVKYFDRIIESAGNILLESRYPGFKRIAPRRVPPTPRYYQRLLDEFIMPGSILIRDARTKGLDDAINGLAVPPGLVELKTGTYVFSPDFTAYPLLSSFFSFLKASTHTPLETVKQALASGEYGLPENMFYFLIAALACAGLISLLRSGRTMPVDTLSLISVQKADAIAPGELISKADRETLMKECRFLVSQGMWDSFGLPAQREVWKSAIKFKENIQNVLTGVSEMLNHYAGYSAFRFFNQKSIEKKAHSLTFVCDEIKISYSAKEGLERYLSAWRGSGLTGDDVGFLKKFHRFLRYQVKSFVFIYHYINHPEVEKAARINKDCEKLKDIVIALLKKPEVSIVEDEGKHLGNVFEHFRDYYSQFYIKNHDEYYKSYEKKKLSKYAQRALHTITALSGIESLDRPPGLSPLLRVLDSESQKKCSRRCAEELQSSPFCSCAYLLDDEPEILQESPENAIENVLNSYCGILKSPVICESLTAWAYAIHDKDPCLSDQLTSFCKTLKEETLTPASMIDFLGQEVITQLGKALSGKVKIVQRDPAVLLSKLEGRRLQADKISRIVAGWLQSDDESTIFSLEGGITGLVKDSHPPVTWWPLLHPDIIAPGLTAGTAYDLNKDRLENTLEKVYPSSDLRKVFEKHRTGKLIAFALNERFHYHAIYKAWQFVCERILNSEQWPIKTPIKSLFMNPQKAGEIEDSFQIPAYIAGSINLSFPEQLVLRLFIEKLVSHPHATTELKKAAFHFLKDWKRVCADWSKTLHPMPRINPDDNPVVVIYDGVSADVWLKAIEGNENCKRAGISAWHKLTTPAKTVDALIELFGFSGDPLDEFHKRDVKYYSLKGNEEHTIADHITPLPDRAVVVRLNIIDRAGHEGSMGLNDMAACLKTMCNTGINELIDLCRKEKRRLIITTDHGFSLQKTGLSHGGGGVFERIIPYTEWGMM